MIQRKEPWNEFTGQHRKQNTNMKTADQIEITPDVASRALNTGTVVASITSQRKQATGKTALRPFQVNVPETELNELRRRINATRWPEKENVADTSQGVPLMTLQELARYWATDYDWRKAEAK